jgi:hypothetical protein
LIDGTVASALPHRWRSKANAMNATLEAGADRIDTVISTGLAMACWGVRRGLNDLMSAQGHIPSALKSGNAKVWVNLWASVIQTWVPFPDKQSANELL